MTSPAKRKGDEAEREAARIIHDLTGYPSRRKLGAGRLDDVGDIDGVPDTVIQVASYRDLSLALNRKLPACVRQQENAGATFGATFLKRPGGDWIVVLTPEQWATYAREAS